MLKETSATATLYANLTGGESRLLRDFMVVIGGSLLLILSARIQVPFFPVPMTLQTLVVLAFSMAVGWRLAGLTMGAYLAEGAAGLPVFAGTPEKGIGLLYMTGPTGGYLLGMLLAAITVGWLAERGMGRHWVTAGLAMLAGTAVIYIPGVVWLGTLMGWDKPILAWGLYPFLPADLLKVALGAAIVPLAWSRLVRQ